MPQPIAHLVRRGNLLRVGALLTVLGTAGLFAACSSSPDVVHGNKDGGGGSGGFEGGICPAGQFVCDGNVSHACDGKGGVADSTDCAAEGKTCIDVLGCVTCLPGQASCANGKAKLCREDGSGFDEFDCDPLQGMTCQPDGCKGSCAPPQLENSYLGCDYYPTMTPNPVWSGFDFVVAVANAGSQATDVHVTRGTTSVKTVNVAPGALQVIKLPWVKELKGGDVNACQQPPEPGNTRVVKGGAYRLRTDQPVTVYQLSPLDYQIDPVPAGCPLGKDCPGGFGSDCLSFSNDASLLMPATTLTANYTSLAWPSRGNRAGFVAVTATQDNTQVQLIGNGTFAAGGGIDAQGNGTVTLARGDVLLALAGHGGNASNSFGPDISGTRIKASAPVQVISGQSCANIPDPDTGECDHIEHAMLPIETLGKDYLVTFPAALASTSPHVVRIEAVDKDTHVTFDPAFQPPATLQPGTQPLELDSVKQDFRVQADQPVLITQYMEGQTAVPSGSGDPSMAVVVPTAQYRKKYLFIASSSYDTNFVNVVAPKGSTVTLDGTKLAASDFSDIGASGFSVARHKLSQANVHSIESDQQFGIVVYGYGRYTSYMYPGGLDLKRIAPPPIY